MRSESCDASLFTFHASRIGKEARMDEKRKGITFQLEEAREAAKIKVVGLGGGGSNGVNRMMEARFSGVEFIVANTDVQVLRSSPAPVKLQLGAKLTGGLGAGSDPDIGRHAAQEGRDRVPATPGG